MTDHHSRRITAGGFAWALTLCSLRLLFTGGSAAAYDDRIPGYASEIVTAQCEGQDVQNWVSGTLTQRIGMSSADWYVISLAGLGGYDLSAYGAAVQGYLSANAVPSATSRERLALAMLACDGAFAGDCAPLLDSSVGQLGIMSEIFGLHLINNGIPCAAYTNTALVEQLVSEQCADGGWSLQGTWGDADVTAMTLQALAPYRGTAQTGNAIDAGVRFLSDTQLASGGWQSYGAENPESTSQAWLALSCLGIDALADGRFIKDGHTALDGILQFRCGEGAYEHASGGGANPMATVQVYTALTAAEMLHTGRGSFYLFRGANPQLSEPVQTTAETSSAPVTSGTTARTVPVGTSGTSSGTRSGETRQTAAVSADAAETGSTEDTHGTADTTDTAASAVTDETAQFSVETTANTTETTGMAAAQSVQTTPPPADTRTDAEKYPYRVPLTAAVSVILAGAAAFFWVTKRRSVKTYATLGITGAAVIALIWVIRIEKPAQYYTGELKSGGGHVTMEIRCDVICGLPGSEAYPADGIILPLTEFSIAENENALDLLYDAVKVYGLQTEVDGVSGDVVETAYVRGIASLYEFDFGDLSGWTYTVNGERPSVGCGAYTLHDGDAVAWVYTIDL